MGGSSSSPRAVTITPDESVVTISEDVARRILGRPELAERSSQPSEPIERKVLYKSTASTSHDDHEFIEGHYERRIKALERQNAVLQQTNEAAFADAVKEFDAKFLKHRFSEPVCVELQQAVERCYASNEGSTLACVDHVKAFKECVQKHRQAMFATRG